MLDFIGKAFKSLFSLIVWIAIILVIIGGFNIFKNNILFAILIWGIGFIFIISTAGLVSIFININDKIEEQNKLLNEIVFKLDSTYLKKLENVNISKINTTKVISSNENISKMNTTKAITSNENISYAPIILGSNYIIKNMANIRDNPDLNSGIIITLTENNKVKLIEVGEMIKMNGVSGNWFKIETENHIIGWCFSGNLNKV